MNVRQQGLVLGIAFLASAPLQAGEWQHEIAPYIWGAALEGQSGIGP